MSGGIFTRRWEVPKGVRKDQGSQAQPLGYEDSIGDCRYINKQYYFNRAFNARENDTHIHLLVNRPSVLLYRSRGLCQGSLTSQSTDDPQVIDYIMDARAASSTTVSHVSIVESSKYLT